MSYKSATINEIISKLNHSYFLPAIQRPFVWEPEQIVRLFDSLMQGYPISSFLFWDLKAENRENWEIYKFIDHFRYGDIHNEKLDDAQGGDLTLVLDGQQRLTSLFIGLKGTYTVKLKHQRKNNPGAWVSQALYLNLLKDPRPEDEDEDYFEEISYGFKFFDETTPPKNGQDKFWFKVNRILQCDDEDIFEALQDTLLDSTEGRLSNDQEKVFKRNLNRLYRMVWRDDAISYYTEKSQSYDKVLDIFIRANDGGTKLSKSDLLMSMVTLKWTERNARDEISETMQHINTRLNSDNDVDRDLILRSGLVLSDLGYVFKVASFTRENLLRIQNDWPEIKEALIGAFKLINRFGIDKNRLTSLNAAIPVAYYLYHAQKAGYIANMTSGNTDAELIRRWLCAALLNGVFGGTANVTIDLSRTLIKEAITLDPRFPAKVLISNMTRRGRVLDFDNDAIERFLSLEYRKTLGFVGLSLLYDVTDWETVRYQKDSVFPLAMFDEYKLRSLGVRQSEIDDYIDQAERVSNLVLLTPDEYHEKSEMDFYEWAVTRDADFLQRHLLPADKELYEPENFLAFMAAREELITRRLQNLFEFDAGGQLHTNRSAMPGKMMA